MDLIERGNAIAEALPGVWKAKFDYFEHNWPEPRTELNLHRITLVRDDGFEIYGYRQNPAQTNKFDFRVVYPSGWSTRSDDPRAGISIDRSNNAIVKSLLKRVIEPSLPLWAKREIEYNKKVAHKNALQQEIDELAALWPNPTRRENERTRKEEIRYYPNNWHENQAIVTRDYADRLQISVEKADRELIALLMHTVNRYLIGKEMLCGVESSRDAQESYLPKQGSLFGQKHSKEVRQAVQQEI